MCLHKIKVNSYSEYGVKAGFVPCGKCMECRRNTAKQWSNRLDIEIDKNVTRKGWKLGFATMTYREEMLPKIPRMYFKLTGQEYKKIYCFKYEDIKRFTDCLRNWLYRDYGLKDGLKYFIVCEKGEKYHRPHYHALLMWEPRISYETMYMAIEDAWRGTQNVIRQNKLKRKRRDLGIIAPFKSFEVTNKQAISKYVSKYVCKDLSFEKELEYLNKSQLSRKKRNKLRHFEPFHKQSLRFGLLENEELVKAYEQGVTTTYNQKIENAPEYIKNKLLFRTYKYYDIKAHKERTAKIYSEYFWNNKETVYRKKFEAIKKRYETMANKEYWEANREKGQQQASGELNCTTIIKEIGAEELAKFTVLWYGVPYWKCRKGKTDGETLISRYNPCGDLENREQLAGNYYTLMTRAVETVNSYVKMNNIPKDTEEQQLIREIQDFFKKY